MRILSIDLPWSSKSATYGFAWLDTAASPGTVTTKVQVAAAIDGASLFEDFSGQYGAFDVILIDQPIGGAGEATTGYRPVERAFANSAFVFNGAKRIQAPRFQPGAVHAANGLENAAKAARHLGGAEAVVMESFPQLSILPLIDFAIRTGSPVQVTLHMLADGTARSSRGKVARR